MSEANAGSESSFSTTLLRVAIVFRTAAEGRRPGERIGAAMIQLGADLLVTLKYLLRSAGVDIV